MPRRTREPEVVDPSSLSREELQEMPHVHDLSGACLKNDAGRRCPPSEPRRRSFTFTGTSL